MAGPEIRIRRAGPADLSAIDGFWRALMAEQGEIDARFALADDAPLRWRNDLRVWLTDEAHRFFLAEREGRAVGFIHGQFWRPAPLYGHRLEVFVGELYVTPTERRTGAGQGLLDPLREWAASVGAVRMRLGVLAANAGGGAFWSAQGARPFVVEYTMELAESGPGEPPDRSRPMGFRFGT